MEDYCKLQQRMASSPHPDVLSLSGIFFKLLNKILPLSSSYSAVLAKAKKLEKQGCRTQALNVLINCLANNYFWHDHPTKWWKLMAEAVRISQDLANKSSAELPFPIRRLLALSTDSPQPWCGFNVSYCFAAFSLWAFEQGKLRQALIFLQSSIRADSTWGYPEYLKGWYGLMVKGIDPIPHFVKAVQLDWTYLQRVTQDPLCKQFPKVIAEVKRQVIVNNAG